MEPQEHAKCRQSRQQPTEDDLHFREGQLDARREQESNIHWVGKRLPIGGIIRARRINGPSVISGLDFNGNLWTVRIALMQQQFARGEPTRVEVRKVPAWSSAHPCFRLLMS